MSHEEFYTTEAARCLLYYPLELRKTELFDSHEELAVIESVFVQSRRLLRSQLQHVHSVRKRPDVSVSPEKPFVLEINRPDLPSSCAETTTPDDTSLSSSILTAISSHLAELREFPRTFAVSRCRAIGTGSAAYFLHHLEDRGRLVFLAAVMVAQLEVQQLLPSLRDIPDEADADLPRFFGTFLEADTAGEVEIELANAAERN